MSDADWLEWRRGGIGASDVARALTGKYGGGPVAVVADKLGLLPEAEETDAMRRGKDLEVAITTAAEALLGLHVVGEQTWTERSGHNWARATLDGFLSPIPEVSIDDITGVLEVKTRRRYTDRPWDYYLAQVHWQMIVADCRSAVIAEAIVDDEIPEGPGRIRSLALIPIEWDEQLADELWNLGETLWAWVQRGEVPPPTVAADLAAVRALMPAAGATAAVDLSEMLDQIERHEILSDRLHQDNDERDAIRARLITALGDATRGTAPGFTIGLSKGQRRALTVRRTK